MYYIAGISVEGHEEGCDFGFDMVERIILDYCLKELPRHQARGLVAEKRFTYYGSGRKWRDTDLLGLTAGVLQIKYRIPLHWENCCATVVGRELLLAALQRIKIKLFNRPGWQCGRPREGHGFFDHIVTYEPDRLRSMLSARKYGIWEHSKDRKKALQILDRFIGFLQEQKNLIRIIFFDDIFCTRLDATAQLKLNNQGIVTGFKYLTPDDVQVYRWSPHIGVWRRS